MHLTMDVLRLIVVRAIRDRTWVGGAVFDSPSSPGDIRVQGSRAPFISVFVDEQDSDLSDTQSLDMATDNAVRIVLEIGVASAKKFDRAGEVLGEDEVLPSGGYIATSLDATDEGLEMQMGLIGRQARDALTSTNDANPWAEIFREFTASMIRDVKVRRGGPSGDQGKPAPRYASRVVIIHTGTVGEPPRGADLDDYPVWKMFFAACEGDPEYGEVAALMKDHIVRPSGALPPWRMAQKLLGLPKATVSILGIAPALRTDDEVATLANVKIGEVE